MHNFPVERAQGDNLSDEASLLAGTDTSEATTGLPDMTRQEFKTEADVNTIIKKFDVDGILRTKAGGAFVEFDFTLDLQNAFDVIQQARQGHHKLPEPLRAKYPSWRHILDGISTGQFQIDLAAAQKPAPAEPAPTPPAPNP